MWSIQDPRDPWAWRNTWTGEIRNSYDDLWIVIPIVVLVCLIALALLLPVLIHRYCRECWPGQSWCRWFESLLFVMREVGREKEAKRIERKISRMSTREKTHDYDSGICSMEQGGLPPSPHGQPYKSRQSHRRSFRNQPYPDRKLDDRTHRKGRRSRSRSRRRHSSGRMQRNYPVPPLHLN